MAGHDYGIAGRLPSKSTTHKPTPKSGTSALHVSKAENNWTSTYEATVIMESLRASVAFVTLPWIRCMTKEVSIRWCKCARGVWLQ